ncbi:MAG TPA: hypothetical protein RMG95_03015, partial [Polyangiaceae bacterium LLY-WYZ-15_(1-7)]|nr:hypothetical protein [Polyangiaceae bacterium LLY-WYZ-15_(1-7)]
LRLEGIALRSADGAPLARIDALEVRPALGRLLRGELALEGGDLEAPRLDLADMDAFLDAVSLAEPSEEEDDEESGPLPDVALGRWRLDRGAVTLADGLVVQGLELDARGSLGPAVAVEVAQLAAEVELDGEPLARLERTTGTLDLGPSAESRLELAIRSGPEAAPDRVDVEARATWGEALADGPARVGAVVDLDVSRQLARRAGAPEVAELLATERVRGHVEAGGALDDLSAEGRLETDAGAVSLEASMEGARYAAAVETEGLALHQLIGTAPEASARGRVEATLAPLEAGPDGEAAAQRVTVRGEGLAYDVYGLEAFELVADLHEEHVELQSLDVPHLERGGHLDLEGRVGFDGDVDVRLDARLPQLARDPNLRRLVPGLRAGVELDLRARLDGEEIDARGHVGVTALELDGTEVERLRVTGRVHGAPGLPRANVSVQGAGLAAAGLRVRELGLSVAGGPVGEGADRGVYRLEGDVQEAQGRRLGLDLRAEVAGERVRLDGTTRLAGLYPTPLTVALTAVRLDADAVAFERVELRDRGGAVAFDASGRYGFGGALDVRARLTRLELAALDRALGLEAELVGAVEADLRAAGRQTAPVVDADVRLEGVGAAAVPPVGGTVHLALAQVDRAAEARLELDLEGALGRVDAGGHARFPTRDPARRPEEAEGEVRLSVAGVDLAAVGALAELEELEGQLDAELRATGSALQPRGHLELEGRAIRWAGGDPITVDADADVGAEARARVAVADGAGAIAELRAGLPLPVAGLARLDALGALDAPWTLELDVARRRLDGYPAPL